MCNIKTNRLIELRMVDVVLVRNLPLPKSALGVLTSATKSEKHETCTVQFARACLVIR